MGKKFFFASLLLCFTFHVNFSCNTNIQRRVLIGTSRTDGDDSRKLDVRPPRAVSHNGYLRVSAVCIYHLGCSEPLACGCRFQTPRFRMNPKTNGFLGIKSHSLLSGDSEHLPAASQALVPPAFTRKRGQMSLFHLQPSAV